MLMALHDLHRCPWPKCESENVKVLYVNSVGAQIVCLKCGARGPIAHSGSVACELWCDKFALDSVY